MSKKKTTGQRSDTIEFDYIKSNHYRVIHADGAVGGSTPTGYIQMDVWSQRRPIPDKVVHALEDGYLGEEVSRESRAGIIREVEAGILLDVRAAIAMRDWIDRQIEELAEHLNAAQDQEEGQ